MKSAHRSTLRILVAATLGVGLAGLATGPAAAAVNDDFSAETIDWCGAVDFVDYGPGAPGGGNNDDYLVIHDYCGDEHGVKAWASVTQRTTAGNLTFPLGSKYNGNGLSGSPVYWDPFKDFNPDSNLVSGDIVTLRVCLVDGNNDPTPASCGTATHTMADG
jgi:hypothetical protein